MTISYFLNMCVNDPQSVFYYLTNGIDYAIKKRLCKITKRTFNEISEYYQELGKPKFLYEQNSKFNNLGQIQSPEWIYTLCRIIKPRIVVETGVASGFSSAYVLKALEKNGSGNLISIDMPNLSKESLREINRSGNLIAKDILPEGKKTGWIVPQELRKRWTLKLGLVKEILVPTLEDVGQIDIFFHDSEHSYKNMIFEFRNSWPHIRPGGMLISHDIDWNNSFSDFASKVHKNFHSIPYTGVGSIIK